MKTWSYNSGEKRTILALGPESDGNFSLYENRTVYFSKSYGDLLDHENFEAYKTAVLDFLKSEKITPDIVLSDLHPNYVTTVWGEGISARMNSKFIQVQHHYSHIFSAIGESVISGKKLPDSLVGIACDGTGYGLDAKIWGGEIFKFSKQEKGMTISRIGHLENQLLLGGDLAIREPARMLISILGKFLKKSEIYKYVSQYYNKNQFELLYNQMQEEFNTQESSSTGRILDAVSVLLGFSDNDRGYKHQPIKLLEENSSVPYQIEPTIDKKGESVLLTTPLFKYLVKNLDLDRKRLAATVQSYIAKGLWQICEGVGENKPTFFAGGVSNNKIISTYLLDKGVLVSGEIPRGDAGISFGQIFYYLLADPRD